MLSARKLGYTRTARIIRIARFYASCTLCASWELRTPYALRAIRTAHSVRTARYALRAARCTRRIRRSRRANHANCTYLTHRTRAVRMRNARGVVLADSSRPSSPLLRPICLLLLSLLPPWLICVIIHRK
jgi:hypothetical protein